MEITFNKTADKITAALNGRLDTLAASTCMDELAPAMTYLSKEIELDLKQLEYISSSGLRIILALHKQVSSKGGKLSISHVNSDIQKVFHLTGLDGVLSFK